jgi:hypothetical protein
MPREEEEKSDDERETSSLPRTGEIAKEQKKNAGAARVSNRICLICPERRLRQPASQPARRESIRIIFMNLILNSGERSYFTVTLSAALY